MSDIVDRLREAANGGTLKSDQGDFGLCDDAADEIEKLREFVKILSDGAVSFYEREEA